MQPDRRSAVLPGVATEDKYVTSSARSMKVDNVNRLIEAVRSWDAFDMEKMLRVASDIAGYEPETDRRYRLAGRAGESEDIERLEWASRWLGLTEPEAEILFDLNGPPYTPSNITQEHLLAVLEVICKREPVERDIWVRNDPGRDR